MTDPLRPSAPDPADDYTPEQTEALRKEFHAWLAASTKPADVPLGEREKGIRRRARDRDYRCREHWGAFDADDDVLYLLTELDALREQLAYQHSNRDQIWEQKKQAETELDTLRSQQHDHAACIEQMASDFHTALDGALEAR